MHDVLDYIIKKGWVYKEIAGNQYNIKQCPFCFNDKWKFYTHKEEGLWDCKVGSCGEKGNLYQLKAKLGDLSEFSSTKKMFSSQYKDLDISEVDRYEKDLTINTEAYQYLKNRGFKDETIKYFRLGSSGSWITIPHFQEGKLWNVKKRNFLEKTFIRVKGQPTVLYNIDNLNYNKSAIVIVEGEFDCIAARQMGIENVVGLTGGASTFKPEWIKFIQKFSKVFLCLDSDEAGQKGAYKIAEKIGFTKCRNVLLPVKDVNDFLLKHSSEEFIKYFGTAKSFNLKNISSISDYLRDIDKYLDDEKTSGLHLTYQKLNSILDGGFKPGDLIILSGDSGKGKTTLALNFAHQFLQQGKKCMAFLLEGKIMYCILRMMSLEAQKSWKELRDNEEEWTALKKKFAGYELYFYSGAQSDMDSKKLKELLPAGVKLYDIDFVMVDNLQKYVRGGNDLFQRTGMAVSELQDMCNDLKIPILLISHITKPYGKKIERVTMHQAKASSDIYQIAGINLTLWKKNTDKENNIMKVTVEKNRMGEGNIDIDFEFIPELATFRESTKIQKTDKEIKKEEKKGEEEFDED